MKILFTTLIVLSLSACSLFPQKYDNNEYSMLVNLVVSAEELRANCKGNGDAVKELLPKLQRDTRTFELYTKHSPRNTEVNNVAKILNEDIREMAARYKSKGHNKVYCEFKADFIKTKATRILEAVGKKSRK